MAGYRAAWAIDYEEYAPIFRFARAEGIPLVAINAGPAYIRFVSLHGVERLSPGTLSLLKFKGCDEEPDYKAAMAEIWDRMDHGGDFTSICNIRRFREAVMALNIAQLLVKVETVVALLGAAHAVKPAVPAMVTRHAGETAMAVLVPAGLGALLGRAPGMELADFVW